MVVSVSWCLRALSCTAVPGMEWRRRDGASILDNAPVRGICIEMTRISDARARLIQLKRDSKLLVGS